MDQGNRDSNCEKGEIDFCRERESDPMKISTRRWGWGKRKGVRLRFGDVVLWRSKEAGLILLSASSVFIFAD